MVSIISSANGLLFLFYLEVLNYYLPGKKNPLPSALGPFGFRTQS